MGTFHDDHGPLHGITVVVDTAGPTLYVGRCHEVTDDAVDLRDADVHVEGEGRPTKAEYLAKAAEVGFWGKHARLLIDRAEVSSITPLGDLAGA